MYTVINQIVGCKLDSSRLANPLHAMITDLLAVSILGSQLYPPRMCLASDALRDSNVLVKMRLIQSTVPTFLVKEALAL